MALFFFLLAILFGILAIYPFVLYPLSLYVLRQRMAKPLGTQAAAQPLTYAICMCAYNERACIVQKAENLRALQQAMPGLEVLIYIDAASDGTAEALEPYKDHFKIHVSPERHGKTYGMNLLVGMAQADIILFTDANVMLDVKSVAALANYYADPEVGCVCGHLIYTNGEGSTETANNGSLYWRLEEFIKQLESETGSLMGADGSIFSIRRKLHHAPPADIIDDMYVSFSILCDGYRLVRAPDVIAYEESVTIAKEEFRRKVRIACQAFNVHRLMWPRLRQLDAFNLYKYVAHKLLRWFVLYWIALSVVSFLIFLTAAGFAWLAALLLIAVPVLTYVAVKVRIGLVVQLVDIFYAFAATALGVWRSVRGDRFQTWTPAQSIRK